MANFKFLKTMVRVRDLDKSIDFYTRILGMRLLRRKDYSVRKFTVAFVGYGEEAQNTVIELTHNWDRREPYNLGEGFGYLAFGVPDIYTACERLEKEGVPIVRPPGPMVQSESIIAFIQDPDGYRIELVEKKK